MPDFAIEDIYSGLIAGVDEAGRGPWAGPVVAAAVILDRKTYPEGMNDSKKLSKEKREKLFAELINNSDFGIGIVSESVIDQVNILQATKLAMQNAVHDLLKRPAVVLIDGNQKFEMRDTEMVTVVKGDSKSLSIAAASIIAKVTRDMIMADLHEKYPQYGWNSNAGYGTEAHIQAIEKHGVCKHHRKSYAPIKKYMAG